MNLIELVPRDLSQVTQEAHSILDRFDNIHGINIPDVLRLPNRSYDVAEQFLSFHSLVIPHIRVMDRSLEDTVSIIDRLVGKGLTHVLIVSGDQPDLDHHVFKVTSVDVIKQIKVSFNELKVYGALDPYRTTFDSELSYIQEKKNG